ncbi:hypothetical protein PVAND_016179 [Polypedilum vanderplanki]|uniref:PvLEA25 protein n=1 Tax=Polypedilum vanderplanki TaxID=319348 RepID=S6BEQ8_POLVA|nr:hypothetical protein PVAND_016179 [Polypedilum vanderplanki]BAN67641.1 PvLEA25 protein [Polypedilum vanderplanki]
MVKDKIIDHAAEQMIDVKDAPKEKVERAKQEIKNAVSGELENDENSKNKSRNFGQGASEKSNQENKRNSEEGNEKSKVQTDRKFAKINEKESLQEGRFFEFDSLPPYAAQRVTTMLENIFEPVNSAKTVPAICFNLRRILK